MNENVIISKELLSDYGYNWDQLNDELRHLFSEASNQSYLSYFLRKLNQSQMRIKMLPHTVVLYLFERRLKLDDRLLKKYKTFIFLNQGNSYIPTPICIDILTSSKSSSIYKNLSKLLRAHKRKIFNLRRISITIKLELILKLKYLSFTMMRDICKLAIRVKFTQIFVKPGILVAFLKQSFTKDEVITCFEKLKLLHRLAEKSEFLQILLDDSLEKIIEQHELIEIENISSVTKAIILGEPKTHYVNPTLFLNFLVSKNKVENGRLESVGILLDDINFVIKYLDNERLFRMLTNKDVISLENLKRLLVKAN